MPQSIPPPDLLLQCRAALHIASQAIEDCIFILNKAHCELEREKHSSRVETQPLKML